MNKLFHLSFLLTIMFLFSACTSKQTTIIKADIKKEQKEEKILNQKQIQLHKTCNNYRKYLSHSKNYILNEFEKGYFVQKDTVGAQAQLFLIENNSPTPFATNINKALQTYNKYYSLAKRSKCNLSKYQTDPISQIKINISNINKEQNK